MAKITVGIKVEIKGSPELKQLAAQITDLTSDPRLLTALLRKAAAETILKAWRERFYAALPALLNMERADAQRASQNFPDSLKNSLLDLHDRLESAVSEGNQSQGRKLLTQVQAKEEALQQALEHADGSSSLSTGKFRDLAISLINLMTEVDTIGLSMTSDTITLGIGPIDKLDAVKTPSATGQLTGSPTSSTMTTMWRQLEFGTGVYAAGDPDGNPGSKFKDGDGSWWYGRQRGHGLHLLGTPGAHAVYDMDGVAYDVDALRFEQVFSGLFFSAINP